MVALTKKECVKCKKERVFMQGTPRDEKSICGNCWDWHKKPSLIDLSDEDKRELLKQLKQMEKEESHSH